MTETTLQNHLLEQLISLLDGGQAHVTFEAAVADLPFEKQGVIPADLPYSAWQLLEHLRIAQRDIVDFSDNGNNTYQPLQWPKDYWPEAPAPPTQYAWQQTLDRIREDRRRFESLLASSDLTKPFSWGEGQTLLRQALLIADHNAYHLGELVAVRRLLGEWNTV